MSKVGRKPPADHWQHNLKPVEKDAIGDIGGRKDGAAKSRLFSAPKSSSI